MLQIHRLTAKDMTMSEQTTSRFTSQKPEDIEWRVNVARVDAAIEGMVRDPILAAHMDRMRAAGATTEERLKFVSEYFPNDVMSAAE